MKTFFFSLLILFSVSQAQAQLPEDALRYSLLTGDGGTARNQALGGAGGSLGGEFTSLFMNPAGLGFYKTGDFVITPSFLYNSNEASYLDKTSFSDGNKISLGASGVLFSNDYKNRDIKSVTIGIGIDRGANFNNNILYQGKNNKTSYSEKFLEEFQNDNVTNDSIAANEYPGGSSLAFNTYLINPTYNSSDQINGFSTLANPAFGLQQTMNKITTGGITNVSIGVGANQQDKFYFGGTLSIPILKYHREANYQEEDLSGDPHNNFDYFEANEVLETKGVGINAKLGLIYKPNTQVQLGLAFTTPTFFQLTDLYNMTIITDLEGYEGKGVLQQSSAYLNNDAYLKSTYNLVTPLRALLSGTYFFSTGEILAEQKGFITADVEYVNYRSSQFKDATNTDSYKTYFKSLNNVINGLYAPAVNVRLGGELKLNTVMVRLGGAYYGNPYSNGTSSLTKVTGGLGYRNRGIYIDLAYTYGFHKDFEYPYKLQDKSVSNYAATLNNTGNNIALTVGFKLY